jgi:hypothetical protein
MTKLLHSLHICLARRSERLEFAMIVGQPLVDQTAQIIPDMQDQSDPAMAVLVSRRSARCRSISRAVASSGR